MKRLKLRWLALVAVPLLVGLSLLVGETGRAQLAVTDAGNLVQTTSTALSTARMLQTMLQQLAYMRQSLASIDARSFTGLENLLIQGQMDYQMLAGDVQSLGFMLGDVNRGFDRLFPKDKNVWHGARYSDYDNYYGQWNAEVTASAKVAARAQSAMTQVEVNNRAVAQILVQSAAAPGEVRQLQLINQQLAAIHARLGDLVQNIATLGRITADMAASSSGEKLLLREAKLRRRDGYTDRGHPPTTLTHLP